MRNLGNAECGGDRARWPEHMARAFSLARSVLSCAPNPRVGCVLVRGGRVVAEGFHAGAGQAHAEAAALAADPEGGAGATAFVTLEPCSHEGRTGPCTGALIEAGVKQVVIAMLDPNPRVSGVAMLEEAGIEVFALPDFATGAAQLNPGFIKRVSAGRPFLRCKLAMSLDGRTALASGASQWITGPRARADAQILRGASCAVLTGIDTVIADDPALNVRPESLAGSVRDQVEKRLAAVAAMRAAGMAGIERPSAAVVSGQPLRVILDSHLRTPPAAKTLSLDGAVKIFSLREPARAGQFPENVEVIAAPAKMEKAGAPEKVDLEFVLDCLAARFECNEVLVEAGPTLGGALLAAGLVDELVIYMAPRLLGGDAKPLLELAGPAALAPAPPWEIRDVKRLGDDLRISVGPRGT